ncbi:MAG: hypothetical protein Q7V62_01815 [Actinomycetota bacterium]|nr:hypothetical protein [Actinomycetota bacterium]
MLASRNTVNTNNKHRVGWVAHMPSSIERYHTHNTVFTHDVQRDVIVRTMRGIERHTESGALRLVNVLSDSRTFDLRERAEAQLGNIYHGTVHLLRHTPSFLNSPTHDHARIGYALPGDNLTLLLSPASVIGSETIAASSVAREVVVVCVDNPAAHEWARNTGADRIVYSSDASTPIALESGVRDLAPLRARISSLVKERSSEAWGLATSSGTSTSKSLANSEHWSVAARACRSHSYSLAAHIRIRFAAR